MRLFSDFSGVDRLFAYAERATALLDRCRPQNWTSELSRVVGRFEAGDPIAPSFRYLPKPDFGRLREALAGVSEEAKKEGALGALYAARALELHREASIVAALGDPDFSKRAAERFPIDVTDHGVAADALARAWAPLSSSEGGPLVRADDAGDPRSLVRIVSALVGSLRLPVRITTSRHLACAAAAGDGFVVVRAGVDHRPRSARRIAVHEIYGHVLPRLVARSEPCGLFTAGTAGSSEDEEGRALLLEQRCELTDDDRRRELAVRHFAAHSVRDGADFIETARIGVGFGGSVPESVAIAARVHRGGGLAREIVYLPALCRLRAAFGAEPELERWLERGRISVDAARVLARDPTAAAAASKIAGPAIAAEARYSNVATTGV